MQPRNRIAAACHAQRWFQHTRREKLPVENCHARRLPAQNVNVDLTPTSNLHDCKNATMKSAGSSLPRQAWLQHIQRKYHCRWSATQPSRHESGGLTSSRSALTNTVRIEVTPHYHMHRSCLLNKARRSAASSSPRSALANQILSN